MILPLDQYLTQVKRDKRKRANIITPSNIVRQAYLSGTSLSIEARERALALTPKV
jgi:hypothetical protein